MSEILDQLRVTSILITLLHASSINRQGIAEKLGTSGIAIGKTINSLMKNGLLTESHFFICPHCGKSIETLPLPKAQRTLQLTEKGKAVALILEEATEKLKKESRKGGE